MCQYSATDGKINDWHLVHLGSRAVGGAGLILTEMTAVSKSARITPKCAGLYRDDQIVSWKRVVDFVHANSDAKIGIQLGHSGRKGSVQVPWLGDNLPAERPWTTISASPTPYSIQSRTPRVIDVEEMAQIVDEFVLATKRAEKAGFDCLEINMAHGYLLSSFISPLTNKRSDEYGDDISNRMRFPLRLFQHVRKAWPEKKPISVRISATDWNPGGLDSKDLLSIAKQLKENGCDLINVSTGQVVSYQQPQYGRLYQVPYSELIRLGVGIPTITAGNISTAEDVNSILVAGRADLCAIARAHIWDPYWTRHAAHGQHFSTHWPSPYYSMKNYKPRLAQYNSKKES